MTLTSTEHWYAIQARPGIESAAARRLQSLSLETLLPLARQPLRHARHRAQIVVRPLFKGYLFARFCAALSWRAVTHSHGVIRVVGNREEPLSVDDAIIASLRERMGAEGCVELTPPPLRPGDRVRIASGPLRGWAGVFECDLNDKQRVTILIDALRQGRVVIERDSLELAGAT